MSRLPSRPVSNAPAVRNAHLAAVMVNAGKPTRRARKFPRSASIASEYDRVRTGYDARTLARLFAMMAMTPPACLREIGCGTEQLTLPLAKAGCDLQALDPGPEMAQMTSGKCSRYPVRAECTAFEEWLDMCKRPADELVDCRIDRKSIEQTFPMRSPSDLDFFSALSRVVTTMREAGVSAALLSDLESVPGRNPYQVVHRSR